MVIMLHIEIEKPVFHLAIKVEWKRRHKKRFITSIRAGEF
jgi:hypothetical protein